MSEQPPWQTELQELCEAVLEDRLSSEQVARLEKLVLEEPAARRFYVEYLHQHGCLHWSAAEPACLPLKLPAATKIEATAKETGPRSKSRGLREIIAGLLAASLLFAAGFWFFHERATPLATLVAGKECKWDAGSLPTEVGARLSAGRLRLAEGIARIVFNNGAEVTLEAPADLEMVSTQRCVLHGGRLVANVPPKAIGFVVDTPSAVFKDLGTEFGVHVKDGAIADVQVFNGIVDAQHRASGRTERLLTGKNRRYSNQEVIDFDPLAEQPAGTASRPVNEGTRVVQISTAMGKGKDAYVQPIYPSEHFSDVLLLVKNTKDPKSGYVRKAYIGMDLSLVAGQKILDAQLSVTFAPTGMGFASEVPDATFTVYGLTDPTLDNWDERKIRYNNAPANRPTGAALDPTKVVRLGTFEIAQGLMQGTRSISGEVLVDFLNQHNNAMATFIIVRETIGSGRADLVHGFASKNHPSLPPPTLKLTVN